MSASILRTTGLKFNFFIFIFLSPLNRPRETYETAVLISTSFFFLFLPRKRRGEAAKKKRLIVIRWAALNLIIAIPLFTVFVKSCCATTKYLNSFFSFFCHKKTCSLKEQVHFDIFFKIPIWPLTPNFRKKTPPRQPYCIYFLYHFFKFSSKE